MTKVATSSRTADVVDQAEVNDIDVGRVELRIFAIASAFQIASFRALLSPASPGMASLA